MKIHGFMRSVFWLALSTGVATLGCTTAQADSTLKYNRSPSDPLGAYSVEMIRLALKHMEKQYNLVPIDQDLTQVRMIEEVKSGGLDIMWAGNSREIEQEVEPIRIPIYKGLLGHRILIIRKGDQARFDTVKNIDDLKRIKLGQGTAWSDTKILEANGLQVVKTMKYSNLFYMLDGSRFDAFPRAVFEPFGEIESRPDLQLTIEKNLMLVYKMDSYLFVSKHNAWLARTMETALREAIADGSFDALFYSAPKVQEAILKGDMKNRIVIPLDNPFNSKETPINDATLWLDPQSIDPSLISNTNRL